MPMARGEISWKGETDEGIRREVYARKNRHTWTFYVRAKRFDQWQILPDPPLEDWLRLLDGVRRRISRRLLRPEEEDHLKRKIAALFPGAHP
jgi:hypothetical protein